MQEAEEVELHVFTKKHAKDCPPRAKYRRREAENVPAMMTQYGQFMCSAG